MKYRFSALVVAIGIFTFLLFAQKKSNKRKGHSFRQRQRPAEIALFLTGCPSFFEASHFALPVKKGAPLLRRGPSPAVSGVPRGVLTLAWRWAFLDRLPNSQFLHGRSIRKSEIVNLEIGNPFPMLGACVV
jgi:hypothetical protein